MELSALTRWESLGKDLYAKGQLGHEIERIKQFSRLLSVARKRNRQQQQQQQLEQQQQTSSSALNGIAEEDVSPTHAVDSPSDDDDDHHNLVLYRIESDPSLNEKPEEEKIQDEMEQLVNHSSMQTDDNNTSVKQGSDYSTRIVVVLVCRNWIPFLYIMQGYARTYT